MTFFAFAIAIAIGIFIGLAASLGYGLLMARSWADDELSEP